MDTPIQSWNQRKVNFRICVLIFILKLTFKNLILLDAIQGAFDEANHRSKVENTKLDADSYKPAKLTISPNDNTSNNIKPVTRKWSNNAGQLYPSRWTVSAFVIVTLFYSLKIH